MSDKEKKPAEDTSNGKTGENAEVEIFHRINRLKVKAGGDAKSGPGFLDPNAVDRAQQRIDEKAATYPVEVKDVLKNLTDSWNRLKGDTDNRNASELEQLYNYANHVKDLAATFYYPLMQHFGLSLREFSEKLDLSKPAHHTIVQAHIDAMWAVYFGGIKDHGDNNAKELKEIVSKAIEKHGKTD
ncbi:MAG: hypothetical protein EOM26_10655 [Alphaproteobacteria bacterium]|nr:hypothetical protein [Alphaproteobacteria bacterium]